MLKGAGHFFKPHGKVFTETWAGVRRASVSIGKTCEVYHKGAWRRSVTPAPVSELDRLSKTLDRIDDVQNFAGVSRLLTLLGSPQVGTDRHNAGQPANKERTPQTMIMPMIMGGRWLLLRLFQACSQQIAIQPFKPYRMVLNGVVPVIITRSQRST